MTKLTTHVLDVYSGKPGKGVLVELFYINNSERKKLTSTKLNDDGRANSPLAEGDIFVKGKYELVFHIGDYFKNTSAASDVPFLMMLLSDLVFQILHNIIMFLYLFHLGVILLIEAVK